MEYQKIKVHFVVPTPWRDPDGEIDCVSKLSHICENLGIQYKIFFICNEWSLKPEFRNLQVEDKNIIIDGHDLNYSISKSVNIALSKSNEADYFCFVQSDVHFKNADWLRDCIQLHVTQENVGVIGFRPHKSCNVIENIPVIINAQEFYKAQWSDGFMFFSINAFKSIGYFDERYFGDCESREFCHRLNNIGYQNYWLKDTKNVIEHRILPFHKKTNTRPDLYLQAVEHSRELFKKEWPDMPQ
jgi:hypothetical protein